MTLLVTTNRFVAIDNLALVGSQAMVFNKSRYNKKISKMVFCVGDTRETSKIQFICENNEVISDLTCFNENNVVYMDMEDGTLEESAEINGKGVLLPTGQAIGYYGDGWTSLIKVTQFLLHNMEHLHHICLSTVEAMFIKEWLGDDDRMNKLRELIFDLHSSDYTLIAYLKALPFTLVDHNQRIDLSTLVNLVVAHSAHPMNDRDFYDLLGKMLRACDDSNRLLRNI